MSNEKERIQQAGPTVNRVPVPQAEQPETPSSSLKASGNRPMEPKKVDIGNTEPDVLQIFRHLTQERVMEGVLMAEILGRPLALRRRQPRI